MNYLKSVLTFVLLTCIAGMNFAQQSVSVQTVTDKQHPRILLLKGEEGLIAQSIAANPIWKKMHETILTECDTILLLPPVERIQIGRRLLDKSREGLRRVFYLSYAWRITGKEKYFQRCEKELLAISRFSDWNPSHFLDVAEMTMAVSIAGMTYGALAVAEDYPELSKNMINRAIESITLPMGEYKPDGAYPEGYGYWGYGTSFNVICLLYTSPSPRDGLLS